MTRDQLCNNNNNNHVFSLTVSSLADNATCSYAFSCLCVYSYFYNSVVLSSIVTTINMFSIINITRPLKLELNHDRPLWAESSRETRHRAPPTPRASRSLCVFKYKSLR